MNVFKVWEQRLHWVKMMATPGHPSFYFPPFEGNRRRSSKVRSANGTFSCRWRPPPLWVGHAAGARKGPTWPGHVPGSQTPPKEPGDTCPARPRPRDPPTISLVTAPTHSSSWAFLNSPPPSFPLKGKLDNKYTNRGTGGWTVLMHFHLVWIFLNMHLSFCDIYLFI